MLGIVGLVCSIAGALGLLLIVLTLGFFFFIAFVSLPLSIAGMICGHLGKKKVDRGELPSGRGISQAAFITGLVGVILHVVIGVIGVVLLGLLAYSLDNLDIPDQDKPKQFDGPAAQALVMGYPGLVLGWLRSPFRAPMRRSGDP